MVQGRVKSWSCSESVPLGRELLFSRVSEAGLCHPSGHRAEQRGLEWSMSLLLRSLAVRMGSGLLLSLEGKVCEEENAQARVEQVLCLLCLPEAHGDFSEMLQEVLIGLLQGKQAKH